MHLAARSGARERKILVDFRNRQRAVDRPKLDGTAVMLALRERTVGLSLMHDDLRSILSDQDHGLHAGNRLVAVELRTAIALRRRALNFDQNAGVEHGLSGLISRVELERPTDLR